MIKLKFETLILMISFITAIILGIIIIPILRKLKVGQIERDDGPQSHLKKQGTPTMGGIIMILAMIIVVTGTYIFLIYNNQGDIANKLLPILLLTIGFGLIGFIDDFIIIKKRRSLGLKPWQKIVMQFGLALYVANYQYTVSASAPQLMVPFTDIAINLGPLYVPIMIFVIVGTVNAVNLTDGLDGLASGITLIVSTFFMLLASYSGVANTEVAVLAAATIGACLGFLGFNAYPARIFMGDTGSMALGGAVVAFAILTNSVLLIPLVGGIYFAEAISVILQVASFKLTGKRIFKMAPIHHHFEQCGWPETKVVFTFWIVTIVLAWIGIIAIF